MAELADALDLGSNAARRGGSTPSLPTKKIMKVTIDSKKGLKTNLKVFVDKKTIDEKISLRLDELSKTVNLKGFRPGKVPVDILKKQFGKVVYGEVLEKILKETSTKAIEEKKIKIAGQPKLDLKTYGEGKDLNYTLEIDELPSITLKNFENIKFTEYEITTKEKEVEKRIEEIAKNQSTYTNKKDEEVAKDGDLIVFDYEATIDGKTFEGGSGKNTQIVIGKDLFIEGFDKQLIGIKKKQEKNITAVLPSNYPNKEFSNKKANFKCKVLEIKKPEPVKIDDQFAKNFGAKDLPDLKKLISQQIQNQYKLSLDALAKENILNQIEKMHDVDLPDNLVQQEINLITRGLKKEEIEKNKKESDKIARKRIKLGLILNEYGEKNNLKVEEDEIKNEIQKQIQSMPGQQKQVIEYYQKNPSAAASLRGTLYEEKIINLIKNKSNKIKKIISTEEAEEIIKKQHEGHDHSKSKESKKQKKTPKSSNKTKKIRKK